MLTILTAVVAFAAGYAAHKYNEACNRIANSVTQALKSLGDRL